MIINQSHTYKIKQKLTERNHQIILLNLRLHLTDYLNRHVYVLQDIIYKVLPNLPQ